MLLPPKSGSPNCYYLSIEPTLGEPAFFATDDPAMTAIELAWEVQTPPTTPGADSCEISTVMRPNCVLRVLCRVEGRIYVWDIRQIQQIEWLDGESTTVTRGGSPSGSSSTKNKASDNRSVPNSLWIQFPNCTFRIFAYQTNDSCPDAHLTNETLRKVYRRLHHVVAVPLHTAIPPFASSLDTTTTLTSQPNTVWSGDPIESGRWGTTTWDSPSTTSSNSGQVGESPVLRIKGPPQNDDHQYHTVSGRNLRRCDGVIDSNGNASGGGEPNYHHSPSNRLQRRWQSHVEFQERLQRLEHFFISTLPPRPAPGTDDRNNQDTDIVAQQQHATLQNLLTLTAQSRGGSYASRTDVLHVLEQWDRRMDEKRAMIEDQLLSYFPALRSQREGGSGGLDSLLPSNHGGGARTNAPTEDLNTVGSHVTMVEELLQQRQRMSQERAARLFLLPTRG